MDSTSPTPTTPTTPPIIPTTTPTTTTNTLPTELTEPTYKNPTSYAPPEGFPTGFISLTDAIALISAGTRSHPTVDTDYLIDHVHWLRPGRNFRIPIMRLNEEARRYDKPGSVYVPIQSEYDKVTLEKAIRDQFRKLVGHDYDDSKQLRNLTTAVTDAENGGNMDGTPRRDPTSKNVYGQDIDGISAPTV